MIFAMLSIGFLGFIVWAHHMARVRNAVEFCILFNYFAREGSTASAVKAFVAKQWLKGKNVEKETSFLHLLVPILANYAIPISKVNSVIKKKTRILSPCATVQDSYLSSICIQNEFYTCGFSDWTCIQLIMKVETNHMKNIVARKLTINSSTGINYVSPNALKSIRTRNPLNMNYGLKVHNNYKRVGISARYLNTTSSDKKGYAEQVKLEVDHLIQLSKNNDIKGVNTCVKNLLRLPWFWILCYESIKSNPGMHSLGGSSLLSNNNETIDGISLDYFYKLSKSIVSGNFNFGPIRKIEIPKSSGGTRSLGIADSRDKIVQKGITIILEAIVEHKFLDCSFGFRRGLSCHSAISYIRKKIPSGLWAIEGDISKCFDHFDHKRLVSLISKNHVSEQMFIDLLYKAIKTKIVSINGQFFKNKIGVAQGSVVSPILCNIYLHELDNFIINSNVLSKFRQGKASTINPAFNKLIKLTKDEILEGEGIGKMRGKLKKWKFFHKLRVQKIKKAEQLNIARRKLVGKNRRIAYVRYVDDFIIFVWGTKNDCLEIKSLTKTFLKEDLDLNLSEDKTKITFLKKQKANFLGFQIWQSLGYLMSSKKDVNPMGQIDRKKMGTKYRLPTMQTPRVRVTFSMDIVLRKLVERNMLRFKNGKFFPCSFKPALQYTIPNIINYLKSVFRGISNYYGAADNWYDAKTIYNYFGKFVVAMTIAHKTKSKTPKIFKKYGYNLAYKNENNKIIAEYGNLTNSTFKKSILNWTAITKPEIENLLISNLKTAKKHMIVWPCAICNEKENIEMHHIKHVRKTLKNKKNGSWNAYLEAMRLVNRKTLPVCKKHHNMIHRGEYDGKSLSNIFDSFKNMGLVLIKLKRKHL